MPDRVRTLVVDADRAAADAVAARLNLPATSTIECAGGLDAAMKAVERSSFDLTVASLSLAEGLTLLGGLAARSPYAPFILIVDGDSDAVADAMKTGIADVLRRSTLTTEALNRSVINALALHAHAEQRRQAEAALHASEQRFRALVEHSSDTILLLDPDGVVRYASRSMTRDFGWTPQEIEGRPLVDLVNAAGVDRIRARIADASRHTGAETVEMQLRHRDGSLRTVEAAWANHLEEPAVTAIVLNVKDVTERRRLEHGLRQALKMDAVGKLAGGIAHDFNNLLTAILGYCDLMLDDGEIVGRTRRDLVEIRTAGERAASLTRQLLAFSRRQMLQPKRVDLNDLVREIEPRLREIAGGAVTVTLTLASDLMPVIVDPSSIQQVVLNLASNARDAMPRGGQLTIATVNVDVDRANLDAHMAMIAGRYVVLSVTDTGHGMTPDVSARVFEPFFTTRAQGKGSGLGLATVYGIVKQSGGFVWVRSEPQKGATFRVYLPPADQS